MNVCLGKFEKWWRGIWVYKIYGKQKVGEHNFSPFFNLDKIYFSNPRSRTLARINLAYSLLSFHLPCLNPCPSPLTSKSFWSPFSLPLSPFSLYWFRGAVFVLGLHHNFMSTNFLQRPLWFFSSLASFVKVNRVASPWGSEGEVPWDLWPEFESFPGCM